MNTASDRLSIIEAIEGASDAELHQLSLIRKALENLSAANQNNISSSPSNMTVKRSVTKGSNRSFNGPLVGGGGKNGSHEKDDISKKRTLKEHLRKGGNKSGENGKNSSVEKDNNELVRRGAVKRTLKEDKNGKYKSLKDTSNSPVEKSSSASGRDSNGRFTSKDASAKVAENRNQQIAQRSEEKRQQGFFRRLSGVIGEATQSNSDAMSSGADLAGTAAGGPLWMMGKGMYDISAEVGKNVVSLKEWMNKRTEGNLALKTAPAQTLPPVTAKPQSAPALGNPKSADKFKNAQQARQIAVTKDQTKILAANDDRMVKSMDEVRDEVKKLVHNSGRSTGAGMGGAGGILDSIIPGRRNRRNRRERNKKPGEVDPNKKPAGKSKGIFSKVLNALKGGEKAALAAGATAATAATGAVVADKVTSTAAEATAKGATEKVATKTVEKTTEKAAEQTGLKVAGKVAGKTALKAIPIVGTAIGAGMDAFEGYNDTEGQKAAFGLKDKQEVSSRQKGEYTTANVLNMGGLLSGGAGLLAKGASALGMESVAKSLNFDTGDIAKGLDSGLTKVGDMFGAFTSSATGVYEKLTGSSTDQTKAIKEGADKTVSAINQLGTQLQGGDWGTDGVGSQGRTAADYADVAKNNIGADLNIGGANAKVRSFRNNNFGNLNFVDQEGASLESTPGSGKARFAKFNTPEEGFRALANQLTSYSEGTSKAAGYKKLNSIEDIIKLYAPSSENNTSQYVDSLSKKMGVKPGEQLNLKDPKMMTQLMRGIATIEGGNPQVTNDWIEKSIGHNENGKWVGGKLSDESLKAVNEARAKQGQAAISADSLYTSGNKVKLAQPDAQSPVAMPAPIAAPAQLGVADKAKELNKALDAKISDGLKSQNVAEKLKGGAGTVWGKVKEYNQHADQWIKGQAISNGVEGVRKLRPTSELSLPAGDTLPAGLQLASLSPDKIASRSRPAGSPDASFGQVRAIPNSATAPAVASARQTAIQAQPDDGSSLFDRVVGGAMTGVKAVGASVMPALGDTLSQTMGGFSGNDMVSGLMQQAGLSDPSLMRAVSPLTSKAGSWLDGGNNSITSAGKSLLSGGSGTSQAAAQSAAQQPLLSHPKQIPNVTDLARSGVRPMMNGDNAKHDPDILKEMKRLTGLFEEMLGLTKKKSDSAPDKVVNTAQPAPRQSSTLSVSDAALNEILQD